MSYWYSFILGRTPELSRAELESVLKKQCPYSPIELGAHFFIIETEHRLDIPHLMNSLGGTIKIGEGLGVFSYSHNLPSELAKLLTTHLKNGQKIFFGCSVYGALPAFPHIQKLGLAVKTTLKDQYNRPSRLVTSRESTLSSVVVATNKLLSERGAELQLFPLKNKIYAARTRAVQNFADFSNRDYGRPRVDPHSGMLPPKIARVMVNCAELEEDEVLLDPFCGSGTMIMEAALLYPTHTLRGSDASERAITDTQKNIEWLKQKYSFIVPQNIQLLCEPIEVLNKKMPPHSIDAIVTEPYLGPALRGTPSKNSIDHIVNELNPLYTHILHTFHSLLKQTGRVVMIWPVFAYQKSWLELPAFRTIETYFKIVPLTPASPTIIYSRPDQKVGRLICKLTPKI